MTRRLIPRACLPDRYGVNRNTVRRWEHNTSLAFPKPIVISGRKYYDEDELYAWEDARRGTHENPKPDIRQLTLFAR